MNIQRQPNHLSLIHISSQLDAEIPRELFQAVAEVIAYVWRLRARAR